VARQIGSAARQINPLAIKPWKSIFNRIRRRKYSARPTGDQATKIQSAISNQQSAIV